MKKIPLMISSLALAGLLAACGDDTSSPAKTAAVQPPENTAAPAPGATSEAKNDAQNAEASTGGAPASTAAAGASETPATAASAQDSELSKKVKEELSATSEIQSADTIQVTSADGVVTLMGTVKAPEEKERAAILAVSMEGVRSVVNNLVVSGS